MNHTTMKTASAISAMMRNILSVAKIPPATVTTSQMARIAPRIVPIIRPMYPVCTRLPCQATGYAGRPGPGQGRAGRMAYLAGTTFGAQVVTCPADAGT
jgi:hypothetical protein